MSRSSVPTVLVGRLLVSSAVLVASSALAAPPELVSPLGVSGDRCPTFSWSAVPGVSRYELVIYATGSSSLQQNRTFIAGIRGITTANADAINVLIDTAGQLGTVSSSREVKQDIREIGDLSRRLLELRPVAFRYRQHVATDPETPLQFGLLAEEVAEVMPELVVVDGEGRPETVKYHLLAALLLNELQRTEGELVALRNRMVALERGRPAERRGLPWWRRLVKERDGP